MEPYGVLTLQLLVVVSGTLALGWWLRHQLPVRWRTWGWGALAFVASQAARLPLLVAITFMSRPYFTGTSPELLFWINFALLTGTSGLFEETARYVVLRWLAKDARRWTDAVMFGAGHGGIEAILIAAIGFGTSLVLLLAGDTLLSQLQASAPDQAAALAAQINGLRGIQWWTPLPGVWERVLAITVHIALSILVVRAVRERKLWCWALAVLYHAVVNGVALLGLRYGGLLGTELGLTAVTALAVYLIVRTRRLEGSGANSHALATGPYLTNSDSATHKVRLVLIKLRRTVGDGQTLTNGQAVG